MSEHIFYHDEKVIYFADGKGMDVKSRHRQREVTMSDFPQIKSTIQRYVTNAQIAIVDVMARIQEVATGQAELDSEAINKLTTDGRAECEKLLYYSEVEGLSNAWKHGNKCNHEKPLYWETKIASPSEEEWKDLQISFRVGDTGEGYPDTAIPRTERQRKHRDDVEKLDGGRGVIMLEIFFDEVRHGIQHIDAVEDTVGKYESMHVLELSKYIFQDGKATRARSTH